MQTFIDRVHLAKGKRIDELLEKGSNLVCGRSGRSLSEEQLPRNILAVGNNKAVDQNLTFFANLVHK